MTASCSSICVLLRPVPPKENICFDEIVNLSLNSNSLFILIKYGIRSWGGDIISPFHVVTEISSRTDITNGGSQGTGDERFVGGNLTTMIPITRIVTSKATTNYEILSDATSSSGLTQATIISEPYFDAQTPRNVTGLVGEWSRR